MSDYMPFDMQVEIIKRVPIETLLKFRSVSKRWKSLIESSKFITDHTFHPQHPQYYNLLLIYHAALSCEKKIALIDDNDIDDNVVTFSEAAFSHIVLESDKLPPILENYVPVGSSYGLVFLFNVDPIPNRNHHHVAVISNPLLKKYVVVVVPDIPQEYDIGERKSKFVIGFGVCPNTFDPKIVKYNNTRKHKPGVCEVFTLSSGVWRGIVSKLRNDLIFYFHTVVIDRFIYWLADCNDGLHLIISFDLTNEEFGEICLPDKLARGCFKELYPLYQLRDSLVVVTCKKKAEKQVFKGWMMMENRSFTKLFTIREPDGLVNTILGFRENGQVLMEMVTENDDNDNNNDNDNDDVQPNDDNDDDQLNDDNDDGDGDDEDDDDDVEISYVLVAYEPWSEQIINLDIYGRYFSILLNSYVESLLLLNQ